MGRKLRSNIDPGQLGLNSIVMRRCKPTRVVEGANHEGGCVRAIVLERYRRPTSAAKAPPGNRRGAVEIGPFSLPGDLGLIEPGERGERIADRSLAHAAVAVVHIPRRRGGGEPEASALAPAGEGRARQSARLLTLAAA